MDETVKLEAILDTYKGKLSINLLDAIDNLTDEQKAELVSDGGWWNFIDKAMAERIVNEFSRDNYNEEYTRLRGLILNSEAMPSVIREWAVSLIESREKAKQSTEYWNNAYWRLYHWAREKLENDRDFNPPILPDHYYDRKYSDEFMAEVEANIKKWSVLFPAKQKE
jgi:hypothetical protein